MPDVNDRWAAGSTYEEFMGRWSRLIAPRFVSWIGAPEKVHWLDVGCGTGSLAEAVCSVADPASVLGCDPAEPFIKYAQHHLVDTRVTFVTAGTGSLQKRSGGYGSTSSLFALNFFPDPQASIEEMCSLTEAGGVVSGCVWDYAGRMEFLRLFWDAASASDPEAGKLDEGARFPLCQRDALLELFRQAGLRDLLCEAIDVTTGFSSFDDYWRPFLGGTGPAPSYLAALEPERREALAMRLKRSLPRQVDGTICLTARAWAVRGVLR